MANAERRLTADLDLPVMDPVLAHLRAHRKELEALQQLQLLDESQFLTFARNRNVPVFGVVKGDPGRFLKKGWLRSDGRSKARGALFHPFRFYPLLRTLQLGRLGLAPYSLLSKPSKRALKNITDYIVARTPKQKRIAEVATAANKVADLAIALEPIYWPHMTGMLSYRAGTLRGFDGLHTLVTAYKNKTLPVVARLDKDAWQRAHEMLRIDAAQLDDNTELYLLLRASNWTQRSRIKGQLSAALWLRHMAEVIRLAFEESTEARWPEEDQAFGIWMDGARKLTFGLERPLDNLTAARPNLAGSFGLWTGSSVRWYVEGDTEFYAIRERLGDPARSGIELVNLRGAIRTGSHNAPLRLQEMLEEDRRFRRFSMISFDTDVSENRRAITNLVKQGNVVGLVTAHRPDFEFSNFTLHELISIAAELDEKQGADRKPLTAGDWSQVRTGHQFEERYKKLSVRKPRSLKGEEWGRALGRYLAAHQERADNGAERPFGAEIRAAMQARTAHYEIQRTGYRFDPETFELVAARGDRST